MFTVQCKEDAVREGFNAQNSASESVTDAEPERPLMKPPLRPTQKNYTKKIFMTQIIMMV